MINIVTIKWGEEFDARYVNLLYTAVLNHTSLPFKFYCFTNEPDNLLPEIIVKPLPYSLPTDGCWPKLYLFSKEAGLSGRVVYLDLDTIITGDITPLLSLDVSFASLYNIFKYLRTGKREVGGGILVWDADKYYWIWKDYIIQREIVEGRYVGSGDQGYLNDMVHHKYFLQDLFPNKIVSYKAEGYNPEAMLVYFHGSPRPHEVVESEKWLKDRWVGESCNIE